MKYLKHKLPKPLLAGIVSLTMLTNTASAVDPVLTDTQLHAVLGVVTNFILDDGGITHNGTKYDTVTSPYTGRVWLDRNLGASQVCTSATDTACYGDYYQWGRGYDGHQDKNSPLATSLMGTSGHGNFVLSSSPIYDWTSLDGSGAIRQSNWLKTDGTSVCPVGFRVPIFTELQAELSNPSSVYIANSMDAFNSVLKIPLAGYRMSFNGDMDSVGSSGSVWSSTASTSNAFGLYVSPSSASVGANTYRAHASPVRCIQKISPEEIVHHGTVYATVTSPHTGKVWLDRNLGADRICTSFDDVECYGNYYQWGRNHDGHQEGTSNDIPILANDVGNVGHGYFITSSTSPYDWAFVDNNGVQRTTNWSKTDGSSVCPVGYRVPSYAELSAETLNVGVNNRDTAYSNFLKLPSAGFRSVSINSVGTTGFVWTSSVYVSESGSIAFDSGSAFLVTYPRRNGESVRCVKD